MTVWCSGLYRRCRAGVDYSYWEGLLSQLFLGKTLRLPGVPDPLPDFFVVCHLPINSHRIPRVSAGSICRMPVPPRFRHSRMEIGRAHV